MNMCYVWLFIGYTEWKGYACEPFENTTWKNYQDAQLGCSINPSCTQFWQPVLNLEDEVYTERVFFYCKHGSKTRETGLAELYKKGKKIRGTYHNQLWKIFKQVSSFRFLYILTQFNLLDLIENNSRPSVPPTNDPIETTIASFSVESNEQYNDTGIN